MGGDAIAFWDDFLRELFGAEMPDRRRLAAKLVPALLVSGHAEAAEMVRRRAQADRGPDSPPVADMATGFGEDAGDVHRGTD